MIHQIYNLRKYELDLNTKKVPLASLEGKDERRGEGGGGCVGVAADRRMSKFAYRRTQPFMKQCRRPQI